MEQWLILFYYYKPKRARAEAPIGVLMISTIDNRQLSLTPNQPTSLFSSAFLFYFIFAI